MEIWGKCVDLLSQASENFPQSVYASFTKSLQSEWTYLQRVVPNCDDIYSTLKEKIEKNLIPSVLGREVLQREFGLLALPLKWGGLAFRNPMMDAPVSFQDSYNANGMIQHSIKNHQKLNIFEHNENVEKTLKIAKDVK